MDNLPRTSKPKGRYQLKYRSIECTNCGHPLDMSDRFCPQCAQINSTKKPTLKDFFDEFFSSLISYDSKLLKTLSSLLLKPGKITRDYLEGKRISYTNPFRFLLSLSIIYFLMINFNLSADLAKFDRQGSGNENGLFNFSNNFDSEKTQKQLDSLKQEGINIEVDPAELDSLESRLSNSRDSLYLSNPKKELSNLDSLFILERFGKRREVFSALIKENPSSDYEELIKKYELEDSRGNTYAYNAAQSMKRFTERPGSFAASLISKLPFLVFFFLPVFAVFIWVVYIRKKYTYTDHLIFGFHIQSLLFILLIISLLIDFIFNIFTGWIFVLIFMFYLYKAMRKFYQQGRFKTILKFAFLNFVFVILAILSISILLTGSMFTF